MVIDERDHAPPLAVDDMVTSEIIGPFLREQGLEIGKDDRVFVAIQPEVERLDEAEESYNVCSGNPDLDIAVFNYLSAPDVPTDAFRLQMDKEESKRYGEKTRDFIGAIDTISRVVASAVLEVLPTKLKQARSRMGFAIHLNRFDRESQVVMLNIMRGGNEPTSAVRKMLGSALHDYPGVITAWAQRVKTDDDMVVNFDIKGDASLVGKHLVVIEQANATGTTVESVVEAVIRRCGGSYPESVTFCFFNAHRKGIERTLRSFPGSTVFVVLLHKGLNENGYLTHPGCGDVGAVTSQVQDKRHREEE